MRRVFNYFVLTLVIVGFYGCGKMGPLTLPQSNTQQTSSEELT